MTNKLPSIKTKQLIAFVRRNGWQLKRIEGSHRVFSKSGFEDYTIAYHDNDEISPYILKKNNK